jgi:hypothetical protein
VTNITRAMFTSMVVRSPNPCFTGAPYPICSWMS